MGKTRIISFDVLKCLGIFLVIWGHCLAALGCQPYESNSCFLFIYSFHMPLFMMIAGYFFAGTALLRPFSHILKNKSIQLLLPSITWGVIIASLAFVYRLHKGNFDLISFGKSLYATVWFLKCLFLCYVLGWLAHNKLWGYIATICISQIMPVWKFEIMYPCFVGGVLLSHYYREICQNRYIVMSVLFVTFAVVYLFVWDASMLQTQYFLGQNVAFVTLYHRLVRVLIGITASTFLILLFDKLFNYGSGFNKKRWLSPILAVGKETLGIYILQDVIIMGLLSKFVRIEFCSSLVFSIVVTPTISIFVLILSFRLVKLMKRSERLSLYLLGVK